MPDDGLRNSQGNYNQPENHVHKEESAQFGLGIEQRVTDKEQRDIVEVKLHSKNAIHEVGRRGIKDLHHPKPDKEENGNKEGGPEGENLLAAIGEEKRKIDHR